MEGFGIMMKGRCYFRARASVRFVLSLTLALILGLPGMGALGAEPLQQEGQKRIVINIPSRTLWLYEGERITRWYSVGVGRAGFQTPLGEYRVISKIVNPVWEHPYKATGAVRIGAGPRNPLGTRWIGFKKHQGGEYGMHGTDNPSSVGKFVSHGCVRMKTPEAEELFDLVDIGTPVDVVYETVLVRPEGERMRLVVFPDAFGKGMPDVGEIRQKILEEYPRADVDDALIHKALSRPTQQPVVVGRLMSDMEFARQQQAEHPRIVNQNDAEEEAVSPESRPEKPLMPNEQSYAPVPDPSEWSESPDEIKRLTIYGPYLHEADLPEDLQPEMLY